MSCISEEVALEEDRAGLPLPCYAQSPQEMSADRRVKLCLQLQDARRDLDALRERRNEALRQADVCRAWANEATSVTSRIGRNAAAVRFQLEAEADWTAIWDLTQQIGTLERALSGSTPVVLTAEQCDAVDDTAGLCGVAA